MPEYILSIIIENKNSLSRAEKMGIKIKEFLKAEEFSLEKYPKFYNSYKLIYHGATSRDSDPVSYSVKLRNK